jgi:hypothetical protein
MDVAEPGHTLPQSASSEGAHAYNSVHAKPDRSLTLQALSVPPFAHRSSASRISGEQQWPDDASRVSTPNAAQMQRSASSGMGDEGMGVALTVGASTDALGEALEQAPSRAVSAPSKPSVPKMWQVSRSSLIPDLGATASEESGTDGEGGYEPPQQGQQPHARYGTSTTMASTNSYQTAASSPFGSLARRGQPIQGGPGSSTDSELESLAHRNGDAAPDGDETLIAAESRTPLSDLLDKLDRRRHDLSNSTPTTSQAEDSYLSSRPALAAGPSPIPFPDTPPALQHVPNTRAHEPNSTFFEDDSIASPGSPQLRRNTFGDEHEAQRDSWRARLPVSPLRDDSQLAGGRSGRDAGHELSLLEIESNLAAVEAALQDHSLAGSFDATSLRRRIGSYGQGDMSAHMQDSAGGSPQAPYGAGLSYRPAPRVTLPPGSESAIADAVREVRRALSSSHLPRIPSESEMGASSDRSPTISRRRSPAPSPLREGSPRESTPMRAARVRQESMQDVEEAYARMCDLVGSAAGIIAPSPMLGGKAWKRKSAHPTESAKFSPQRNGTEIRERAQSLVAPSHVQASRPVVMDRVTRQQLLRDADSLARHSAAFADSGAPDDEPEHALRGRNSTLSTGSRRAMSESPPRRPVHKEETKSEARRLSQHAEAQRMSTGSATTTKRSSNATTSASGSGGTAALSASPSVTVKTQGTPRSPQSDAHQNAEWNRMPQSPFRHGMPNQHQGSLSRHERQTSSPLSQQHFGGEPSNTFEARPFALNASGNAETRRHAEEAMRRARAQLSSASVRNSTLRSPTPTLGGYRRPHSGSVREWTAEVAGRPTSRTSAASAAHHGHGPAARHFPRLADQDTSRSISQDGHQAINAADLSYSTASSMQSSLNALQRRHALERDSLLDMLERARSENVDLRVRNEMLQSDLHLEVTQVLELQRELERQSSRASEQAAKVEALEAQLETEHRDRLRIAELLERVQTAVDTAANARSINGLSPTASSASIVQEDLQPTSRRVFDVTPSVLAPLPLSEAFEDEEQILASFRGHQAGQQPPDSHARQLFLSRAQSSYSLEGGSLIGGASIVSSDAQPRSPNQGAPDRSPSLRSMPSALGLEITERELDWSLHDEAPLEGAESGGEDDLPRDYERSTQARPATPPVSHREPAFTSPPSRRVSQLPQPTPAHAKRSTMPASLSASALPVGVTSGIPMSTSASSMSHVGQGSKRAGLAERFGYRGPVLPSTMQNSAATPGGARQFSTASRFTTTSAGDTSWSAVSDEPIGGFVHRSAGSGAAGGYYDPRRPQGYDPTALPDTQRGLLEDAEHSY